MLPDSNYYYQLRTMIGDYKMVLDVFDRGRFSYMPHLVLESEFSGHDWLFEKTEGDNYKISAQVLGVNMWLDVIEGGIFEGLLIYAPAVSYSNRSWTIVSKIIDQKHGYALSTSVHGVSKYLDIHQGGDFNNMPFMVDEQKFVGTIWNFEKSQQIVVSQ
ncbi:hypothetical protein FFWV33_03765 [Flavobacterium faecale]|uniref:Uncharacterized protein n=1 Tax=Flavobacterium faecale TaxID=1355330 RepID=A0A2S1LAK1_9FLAO|nr:hypothetical protein [Flavobacterium faecale]AWG20718.1 hypothetical protein FFWV33_03765 [Flavobacterium faecale]